MGGRDARLRTCSEPRRGAWLTHSAVLQFSDKLIGKKLRLSDSGWQVVEGLQDTIDQLREQVTSLGAKPRV